MRDGIKRSLYDDMYSNLRDVKLLLNELVLGNKNHYSINSDIEGINIAGDTITTFKGSSLLNFRSILTYIIMAPFLLAPWISPDPLPLYFVAFILIFGLFWFAFTGWLLHYFQITDTHLAIRNHYWFWEKKFYALEDIAEITFEAEAKQPNSMRIILKDFRTERYRAGSLRDKTWLSLQKALEDHNIKVRNECIYDPQKSL